MPVVNKCGAKRRKQDDSADGAQILPTLPHAATGVEPRPKRRQVLSSSWPSPANGSSPIGSNFSNSSSEAWNMATKAVEFSSAPKLQHRNIGFVESPTAMLTAVDWNLAATAQRSAIPKHANVVKRTSTNLDVSSAVDNSERARLNHNDMRSTNDLTSLAADQTSSLRKRVHEEAMQKLAAVVERRAREKKLIMPPRTPVPQPSVYLSPQKSPDSPSTLPSCAQLAAMSDRALPSPVVSVPMTAHQQAYDASYYPLTPELSPMFGSHEDSSFAFESRVESPGAGLSCSQPSFNYSSHTSLNPNPFTSFPNDMRGQSNYLGFGMPKPASWSSRAALPASLLQTVFREDAVALAEYNEYDNYLAEAAELTQDWRASLRRGELSKSFCDIVQSLKEIENAVDLI